VGIRIEEISVSEHIDQVGELLEEHWLELAKNKELMVLKPDRERYATLERAGVILALGAFDGDRMVGYSVNLVGPHLHYADLAFAQNDVLFIAKSHRLGRTGYTLIKATEVAAKARGAQMLVWHAKQDTALDVLLPRLGYGVQDILYSKEL
jgi:hypothetical protein